LKIGGKGGKVVEGGRDFKMGLYSGESEGGGVERDRTKRRG